MTRDSQAEKVVIQAQTIGGLHSEEQAAGGPSYLAQVAAEFIEPLTQRLSARNLGRLAGATIALFSGGATLAEAHTRPNRPDSVQNRLIDELANTYGVSPSTITGKGLHQLKPEKATPSRSLQQELVRSTVGVVKRPYGSTGSWHPDGTGTVVLTNDGQKEVVTASHLFSFNFPTFTGSRAVDLLTVDSNQYAISNASSTKVIGRVTGASYVQGNDSAGPDVSLLKVDPNQSATPADFEALDSVPIATRYNLAPPKPGENVDMYSLPSAATSLPVAGVGTYIGRVTMPLVTGRDQDKYDVVGLKAKDARKDNCEHGGSGSSFIARGGYVSGPLSLRSGTVAENLQAVGPANLDAPNTDELLRLQVENATKLNLDRFTVLCLVAQVTKTTATELPSGFGISPEPNMK